MKTAMVIDTQGHVSTLDISVRSLEQMQVAVGGYVQAVDIADDVTLWCNEEGKMMGLEHNPLAQHLWDRAFGAGTDYIVGTVVLTGGADDEGETVGLTAEQVASLGL